MEVDKVNFGGSKWRFKVTTTEHLLLYHDAFQESQYNPEYFIWFEIHAGVAGLYGLYVQELEPELKLNSISTTDLS